MRKKYGNENFSIFRLHHCMTSTSTSIDQSLSGCWIHYASTCYNLWNNQKNGSTVFSAPCMLVCIYIYIYVCFNIFVKYIKFRLRWTPCVYIYLYMYINEKTRAWKIAMHKIKYRKRRLCLATTIDRYLWWKLKTTKSKVLNWTCRYRRALLKVWSHFQRTVQQDIPVYIDKQTYKLDRLRFYRISQNVGKV